MAMALPNNAYGFDASNPFGRPLSEHVPAEDSSWIGRLTFKVHDEILKHKSYEGDRLIKKVTAYREDGSEYWTQVFYRSTGSNSSFPGVWFPFLGIGSNGGRSYFAKELPLPLSWPEEDKLKLKRTTEAGGVLAKTRELESRFLARSFLLGANAISALHPNEVYRKDYMEHMFHSGLNPEKVDARLAEIIILNNEFNDFEEEYKNTMPSSDKEINTFIGKDIYINYDGELSVNLSAFNGLPNFPKNFRGGRRSSTRKSRRSSSTRKSQRRRRSTRKGLNKKH